MNTSHNPTDFANRGDHPHAAEGTRAVDPVCGMEADPVRTNYSCPMPPVETRTWIERVLTIPVVLRAGWSFFVRYAQSICNRSPNMRSRIGIYDFCLADNAILVIGSKSSRTTGSPTATEMIP